MKLYRFWARAEATWPDPRGGEAATAAYAGSDDSPEDAQVRARSLLAERVAVLRGRAGAAPRPAGPQGDYPPTGRALREAVLWRQDGPDGHPLAALTRSGAGYVVLNTTRLMTVDVDRLPRSLLDRLRAALRPDVASDADQVARALRRWLRRHPAWGLRAYRTRAGYRYVVTHAPLDVHDPASVDALRRLGADPLYVRLCRAQGCYRARVTPKPHRAGSQRPAQTFPYRDAGEEEAQRAWEARYDAQCAGFATVHLIGQYGQTAVHPDLRALVALHDGTALHPARPLA